MRFIAWILLAASLLPFSKAYFCHRSPTFAKVKNSTSKYVDEGTPAKPFRQLHQPPAMVSEAPKQIPKPLPAAPAVKQSVQQRSLASNSKVEETAADVTPEEIAQLTELTEFERREDTFLVRDLGLNKFAYQTLREHEVLVDQRLQQLAQWEQLGKDMTLYRKELMHWHYSWMNHFLGAVNYERLIALSQSS